LRQAARKQSQSQLPRDVEPQRLGMGLCGCCASMLLGGEARWWSSCGERVTVGLSQFNVISARGVLDAR
jgi:hypothetical protein